MFELMHAERPQFLIAFSCRVLEVSRAGYYAWLRRGRSTRSQDDMHLLSEIRSIHKEHKGRYGGPRIHQELVHRGFNVGRNRVAPLMAENGIQGRQKRPFKATTDSKHKLRVAPNVLERDFDAKAPNEKWVGDITYIRSRSAIGHAVPVSRTNTSFPPRVRTYPLFEVITRPDLADHDPDPGDRASPIFLITQVRSWRSRRSGADA